MAVFDKAKRKVKELDRLQKLGDALEKLGPLPSRPAGMWSYAVKYFNIITKFQDDGPIVAEDFSKTPAEIKSVLAHIQASGRNPYGLVRAQPGEPVTLDNMYLGDTFGIWTNTAARFKASKDPDVHAVIYNQLVSVIGSHLQSLKSNISKIVKKNQQTVAQRIVTARRNNAR